MSARHTCIAPPVRGLGRQGLCLPSLALWLLLLPVAAPTAIRMLLLLLWLLLCCWLARGLLRQVVVLLKWWREQELSGVQGWGQVICSANTGKLDLPNQLRCGRVGAQKWSGVGAGHLQHKNGGLAGEQFYSTRIVLG